MIVIMIYCKKFQLKDKKKINLKTKMYLRNCKCLNTQCSYKIFTLFFPLSNNSFISGWELSLFSTNLYFFGGLKWSHMNKYGIIFFYKKPFHYFQGYAATNRNYFYCHSFFRAVVEWKLFGNLLLGFFTSQPIYEKRGITKIINLDL